MAVTPNKHDDMVDAFAYGMASRGHTVKKRLSWKAIVGWFFYNLVLIIVYKAMPETQLILFSAMLGSSSVLLFRPFTKRWKYTMLPEGYPSYVPKDERHYEFPPAKNFTSPMTGRKYNDQGEPQDG